MLNVGSGRGTSVRQVCDMVAAEVGRPLRIQAQPARPWELAYAVPDPARIAARLGWTASTPLDQTVAKVAAAFRDRA